MSGTNHRTTIVLSMIILVSVGAIPGAAGTVAAQEDPETTDEYFETFRALEGSSTVQEYDELETIRTFAVTEIQEIGNLSPADEARFDSILDVLLTFEEADAAVDEGEYETALSTGEELDAAIAELESHGEAQAVLADIAASRFYEELSGELRATAEERDRTDEEIEILSMAATASERADLIAEAAELRLQIEQRNAELERDMDRIDDATERAHSFIEDCTDCTDVVASVTGNGVTVFGEYQEARELSVAVSDAEERAALHGLEEHEENLSTMATELDEQQSTLAFATGGILAGYGLVLGILGTIIFARLFAWKNAHRVSAVDNVVQVGGNQ